MSPTSRARITRDGRVIASTRGSSSTSALGDRIGLLSGSRLLEVVDRGDGDLTRIGQAASYLTGTSSID